MAAIQELTGRQVDFSGQAATLQRVFKERSSFLTFSPVKNHVLVANPDVYVPLRMVQGEAAPAALFHEGIVYGKEAAIFNKHILETHEEHHRSALLARVVFVDSQGKLYRDIDIKGVGYLHPTYGMTALPYNGLGLADKRSGRRFGFLSASEAGLDYENSRRFLALGARTNAVVGIVQLDEIIVGGNKVTVERAKEMGMLPDAFTPVIEVRAFGTKVRVRDVLARSSYSRPMLEDAKALVEQETGKSLTWDQYFKWFVVTLGENMGKLHRADLSHNDITTHNVTLDCRLVDLGSTKRLSLKKFGNDFRHAWHTLTAFQKHLNSEMDTSSSDFDVLGALLYGYSAGARGK